MAQRTHRRAISHHAKNTSRKVAPSHTHRLRRQRRQELPSLKFAQRLRFSIILVVVVVAVCCCSFCCCKLLAVAAVTAAFSAAFSAAAVAAAAAAAAAGELFRVRAFVLWRRETPARPTV